MIPKEQLERFRLTLMEQLDASAPYAISEKELLIGVQCAGFSSAEIANVHLEVIYLRDAGLAMEETKLISPENKQWKITKRGRDFIAESQS